MLNKQEFTKYINIMIKYREYIETLENIKVLGNDIFDSPLGRLLDEMTEILNISERAQDVIFNYCWDRKYCYNEEYGYITEYGDYVPDNIEELYLQVLVLSYKEVIKERIDYYLGTSLSEFRHHLENAILWDETLGYWDKEFNGGDECAYAIYDIEEESEAEKFINELNEYLKENYPDEKAHIFYDNETIFLVNDNDDINKDLYDGMPEWEVLDYFFGGDHLNTLEYK